MNKNRAGELAEPRYLACIHAGFQEFFAACSRPWVSAERAILPLPHQTLVGHGRED
ncbi:2-hydroxymuconate semialdehyde hydrolase [compost metagenome]